MRKLFFILFLTNIFVYSFSQLKTQSNCNKLKAKGYTENFCEYNKKYSFKNIPLEGSIDYVSSQLTLIKREDNPNQYDCKSDDIRYWANTKFDNCIFDFSSNKKLDGVQLQIEGHGLTSGSDDSAKFSSLKVWLTNIFGKPESLSGASWWIGDRLYIALSHPNNGSGIVLAIFKKDINPLDNL